MIELANKQCDGKATLLSINKVDELKNQLDNEWKTAEDNKSISRHFKFKNYYETMAFVNVVAMIAHQQDHHPDMTVSYNTCIVEFSTHSVGGLSEYDFICAAKIDNSFPL